MAWTRALLQAGFPESEVAPLGSGSWCSCPPSQRPEVKPAAAWKGKKKIKNPQFFLFSIIINDDAESVFKNSGVLYDLDLLLQLTVPILQLLDLLVSLEGGPRAHHLIHRHASTLQLSLQAQLLLFQPAQVVRSNLT